ncbi:MAG: cytochrome c peroxidase [Flavobacteriales bacterium]
MKVFIYIALFSLSLLSCKKEEVIPAMNLDEPYELDIPAGFPSPVIPEDNLLTKYRVVLGKKLFFEKALSKNYTLSCASCHHPSRAFSDTVSLSIGTEGRTGIRNSPSLANLAYKNSFFMDGGIPTLELQVNAPLEDHNEMNINILAVTERLEKKEEYITMSKKAYGREIGPFVITRALAAFERTLISGNSDFDKFQAGNIAALSLSQKRGKDLFFSNRTNCSSCHSGFNFTDNSFQSIGLYPNYADSGRMRITLNEADRNKFVVPSLRNVAVTKPYMHDGSLANLEEVIDFFNSGGHLSANKSNLVRPLNLSIQEKRDLINFLNSLTDNEFLNNKEYKP